MYYIGESERYDILYLCHVHVLSGKSSCKLLFVLLVGVFEENPDSYSG